MFWKNGEDRDKGAVMVEATIYMPVTIMLVMFLIYFGLFRLQQQALLHQVQRVALQTAREAAYPGYRAFGTNLSNEVDFDWGDEQVPAAETIENYYELSHDSLKVLYRELNIFGRSWIHDSDVERYLSGLTDKVKLFALGNIVEEKYYIRKGFFVDSVEVKVSYTLPTPASFRFFEIEDMVELDSAAFSVALNPTDFARNTDLAEILGFSEGFQSVVGKAKKLIGYL